MTDARPRLDQRAANAPNRSYGTVNRPRPRRERHGRRRPRLARGTRTESVLTARIPRIRHLATFSRRIEIRPAWGPAGRSARGVLHELMSEGLVLRCTSPLGVYVDLIEVRFTLATHQLCAAWGRWLEVSDKLVAIEFRQMTRSLASYLADLELLRRDRRADFLDCTMLPNIQLRHATFVPSRRMLPRPEEALDSCYGRCVQFSSSECDEAATRLCEECLKPICDSHSSLNWKLERSGTCSDHGPCRSAGAGVAPECHFRRLCTTCTQLQQWSQQPLTDVSSHQRAAFLRSRVGRKYLGPWELRRLSAPLEQATP